MNTPEKPTLDYMLVSGGLYPSPGLAQEVMRAIENGWEPLGGPCNLEPHRLVQAMVRNKPVAKPKQIPGDSEI